MARTDVGSFIPPAARTPPSPRPGPGREVRRSLVSREVARFVAGALLAAVLVGIGTFVVIGRDAEDEAIRVAETITSVEGHSVIEPSITPALLTGSPAAIADIDVVVRQRILSTSVVRVKIWRANGLIIYSDEPRLIGRRFTLGTDEAAALATGHADANVSALDDPENQFERGFGKLLQVYFPVHGPNGVPLLFETYQRYDAITSYQSRVWSSFVPVLGAGLLLLVLVTVPLAVRLARRLRSSLADRGALLERAITSSEEERRRIARDLHDGVVQNLAAVTFSLSATERRVRDAADHAVASGTAEALGEASRATRQAMKDLRTLIIDIAPPSLVAEGLDGALRDLLDPLTSRGIDTHLGVDEDLGLSPEGTAVLYRAAQEALRNVGKHADAGRVDVRLRRLGSRVRLEVEDDGRGFDDAALERSRADGHVGLSLLRDLVRDAGGTVAVTSRPAGGTHVAVELPSGPNSSEATRA